MHNRTCTQTKTKMEKMTKNCTFEHVAQMTRILKGGDKLTLNLTGASNLTKATNTGQANTPTSPLNASFPSPPASAGHRSEIPAVLLPLDLIQNTDDRSSSAPTAATAAAVNGVGASNSAADTVTVTHFSETRGTMQKISVPSMNIFNAEFKASDANKPQLSSFMAPPPPPSLSSSQPAAAPPPLSSSTSTNPFLNTSSVAVTATKTHTTNPFHVSLNASSNDQPDTTITNNDSPKSNDIVSICSENNNGTIIATTLISKMDPKTPATATTHTIVTKPITTNPFAHAMDDIDNDHNYHSGMNNSVVVVSDTKIKTNNNDALNNLKNNNCMVIERNSTLDNEKNKTIKYIEVNKEFLLLP